MLVTASNAQKIMSLRRCCALNLGEEEWREIILWNYTLAAEAVSNSSARVLSSSRKVLEVLYLVLVTRFQQSLSLPIPVQRDAKQVDALQHATQGLSTVPFSSIIT
jgi:hypothetical protein